MRKLVHAELLQRRLTAEEARQQDDRHPLSFILHNVRSLYNVGSIFRSADALALQELLLCGYTPRPPRSEIAKTALGADEIVPWSGWDSAVEAVRREKRAGRTVLALELTDAGRPYDELHAADFPLTLVLGNELSGIDDELLAECDGAVEIPMFGVKHSFNVSVAAGIAGAAAVACWRRLNNNH